MKNILDLTNKISVGTANFNINYGLLKKNKISEKEISRIFDYCNKKNIKKIDTAIDYNNDNILKNFFLKNFEITTKLPFIQGTDKNVFKTITKIVIDSLKVLNINSFNCILLHNPINSIKDNKIAYLKILKYLKENNITSKVGYSVYNLNELKYLLKLFKPDVIQAPLNIFDNEFAKKDLIKVLDKYNIELETRSIFLQGLLLKNKIPKEFQILEHEFNDWKKNRNLNKLSKLQDCINHVFTKAHVKSCIVGVNNVNQLKKIYSCCKNIDRKKIYKSNLNLNDSKKFLIKANNWKNVF